MAFCMSPKYFLEIIFFLTGAGANGKGVFIKLISNFIGSINTCSKSVELLGDSTQRFQTRALQNKLLCKLGDGNGNVLKDTKILKELAGETDDISAEIKGGGHLSFENKAKLIGCFNTLPITLDKTNGWYRRVYIKVFPNIFDCSKHINLEDYEVEFPNLALRLLNRLKEIYKTKKLRGWGNLEFMKTKYENLSNPIKLFLESELTLNVRGYFTRSKVYEKYLAFAIKNGYNSFGYREFITRFKAQPTIESYRKDVYISDTGMVWGRLEDVPLDLTLKNENGFFMFLVNKKINVFSGYSFKEDVKK
jgi:phage/plasmid-associated DNA primase